MFINATSDRRLWERCSLLLLGIVLLAFHSIGAHAQEASGDGPGEEAPTQVVKGSVRDAQTDQPIVGATVAVVGERMGAIAKGEGSFRIERVPVGRHTLRISAVGYEPALQDVVVTSGRQTIVAITLRESLVMGKEVVVTAGDPLKAIDEAALVSANAFTMDDVSRYAGSREDPARMAQNFAGVLGANSQRNDIIIRGGSPSELLWRLDGIDIPNPNHFATQGATGGPVNALNANLLDNSDFLTGAFPAEYGTRLSGVFDLRTRRGNAEKYELVAQMGFNGFEGMAEGPVPGVAGGSFIASYRKSTLEVFHLLGISFGFSAIPKYEDATLKVDLPLGSEDHLSITALGGLSDIALLQSDQDSVFTGDFDIHNGTDLGVVGITWRRLFSDKMVGQLSLSTVNSRYRTDLDSLTATPDFQVNATTPWMTNHSTEGYLAARYRVAYAADPANYITAAAEVRRLYYDLDQRRFTVRDEAVPYAMKSAGAALHGLGFVNWSWRPTADLTINTGIFTQYLELNGLWSIEPRIGASWEIAAGQSINAGFGIHRQPQPLVVYFGNERNDDLAFSQSNHYVIGYSNRLASDLLVKVEGYYKDLRDIPVDADSLTSYSLLNTGTNFGSAGASRALVSAGRGRSYGAELTVMKHFTDGWYLTATGSLFRQQYAGSDGIWRFGAFDNRYIANLLAGYEWKVSPGFTMEFSGKYTLAGGAPYTPIDLERSRRYGGSYVDASRAYTERNPDYSRLDLRIDFRNNFGSWSLISYVSVENVLNRKNIQDRQYNPRYDRVDEISQLGIFPVGGIRAEF